MVKRCVAGGCSNTGSADVSLHYFPVDEETRSAWTRAVKLTRDGWAGPTKHSVLCSEHFPAECFEQQTSEFAREMMSAMGITYRRRTSLKADAVPALLSASDAESSPETRNQAQQLSSTTNAETQTVVSTSDAAVQRPEDVFYPVKMDHTYANRQLENQDEDVILMFSSSSLPLEATRNTGASLKREYLTICDTPTPDKDITSSLKNVPVNLKPSDALDSSVSANNPILQNIENRDIVKEKSALLQVTNGYVGNEKQLLRLFGSQCPLCQSPVKVEVVVCGVLMLNLQCPQCDFSKEWTSLNNMSIPADAGTPTECTETTLETDSDGVPELVYFVGEESDPTEFSDDSSDPGDMDSGEDWDPENELFLDEELQTESDEETSDDEDIAPKHGELCTECGTFVKKKKESHTCEHKIKPLPCNVCGKRFANELALVIHTRIHSANYEFSCKYCHVKFKTRFNKTAHEQIHLTEEKPYKCPKCSETFARYLEYKTHLEGHGGLTQLKCHFCGVEFSHTFHLQRHLVVHTGEKPYKCPVCERGFNQAGHLKSHMRLHTGEKPFRCQHCDQGFNHNVSLKSHVQRCHTPGSQNQQKTKKRKRDGGDSQANGNVKVADSLLFEAEQETDDVQLNKKSQGKTNKKNMVRPKGRPKRKSAGSLRIEQGSDRNPLNETNILERAVSGC